MGWELEAGIRRRSLPAAQRDAESASDGSQTTWMPTSFFLFRKLTAVCLAHFSPHAPLISYFSYLACSSGDYLESRPLCLCVFVSVSPPTRPPPPPPVPASAVPVDRVSLCLCLLLRLAAWQKPINTTLPPASTSFSVSTPSRKKTILSFLQCTRSFFLWIHQTVSSSSSSFLDAASP